MYRNKFIAVLPLFFILVSCGGGGSAPFTLTLPTNSSITIDEDSGHTSTFIASTNYKSQISYEIINTTNNGESILSSSGSYTYQPYQDYFGLDNLTNKDHCIKS